MGNQRGRRRECRTVVSTEGIPPRRRGFDSRDAAGLRVLIRADQTDESGLTLKADRQAGVERSAVASRLWIWLRLEIQDSPDRCRTAAEARPIEQRPIDKSMLSGDRQLKSRRQLQPLSR